MFGGKSALFLSVLCAILSVNSTRCLFSQSQGARHSTADQYADLVAQAKADLNSGSPAKALGEAQQAERLDLKRWEAYAVAGLAQQILKRCDAAVHSFAEALAKAPAENKPVIENASQQCTQQQPTDSMAKIQGVIKPLFTLRYEDYKIGTGAEAEPGKMYKVYYTGYRAADGVKFDSSFDHPGPPEKDVDGKPVLDADGKPKLGDPQPMAFPQGMGRLIPGFDQGFAGMKIGGKRRLFIPWQLAYGIRAIPDHGPGHPGIPAKSDLVFDVELVDVTEMPATPTATASPSTSTPSSSGSPKPN